MKQAKGRGARTPILRRTRGLLRHHVRRRWKEHGGLALLVAALLAIVLGVIGFRQAVPDRTLADYLYRALQLFVITSGTVDPARTPVALDVARFLAPAATAAASIRALLSIFGQQAAELWVRYFVRDHVVICGLGETGERLAKGFEEDGHQVVVVERDAAHAAISECRARGTIVLPGDATDPGLLHKAGIHAARHLVVACGSDETNVEVAVAAREARRARPGGLTCFVEVESMELADLLEEAAMSLTHEQFRLEFFNPVERAPASLLEAYPLVASDPPPHVVIVGTGQLAEGVAVLAARRWRTVEPDERLRLTILSVPPDGGAAGLGAGLGAGDDAVRPRHRAIEKSCELVVRPLDLDEPGLVPADLADVSAVFVCLDDDAQGLKAGLLLSRLVPDRRADIVVLTYQRSGLAGLLTEAGGGERLKVFDVLDRTCRPAVLLHGINEILAEAIHNDYVRHHAGATAWDDLPEAVRESNRQQAADVGTKLAAVGCRIESWSGWDAEPVVFTTAEIELMARMEHDRWMRERAAEGWSYSEARDDARKRTPYLVAWDQLTEPVRDYDRDTVRNLPEFLAAAGFFVVRERDAAHA